MLSVSGRQSVRHDLLLSLHLVVPSSSWTFWVLMMEGSSLLRLLMVFPSFLTQYLISSLVYPPSSTPLCLCWPRKKYQECHYYRHSQGKKRRKNHQWKERNMTWHEVISKWVDDHCHQESRWDVSRETVDLVLYSFLLFFPVLIVFMSVLDLFIWFWLSSKRTHKLKNMFHFKFSFMSLFQHAFVVIILQCITWFRKVLCFVFSLVCSYFLSFFYLWHKEKVSSVKDELKFEGRRDSIRDMMTIMMKLCRWIHRMMNEWDSRGKGKTSSVQRESLLSLSSFSIICLNPLDDGLVSWFRILFLSLLFLHIRSSSWRRKGRDRHLDEILLSYPAHSFLIPFSSFICLQVILHPWLSLSLLLLSLSSFPSPDLSG